MVKSARIQSQRRIPMKHSTTRRGLLASAVAFAAAVALAACSGGTSSPSSGSTVDNVSLTIGAVQPTAAFSLAKIATDNDLWPKGLDVKSLVIDSSSSAGTLATNRVQFAIAASPQMDIAAANANVNYRWVGEWQNPSDFQFIAAAGRPDLASLKGAKIGVTFAGSTTDILAQSALLSAGLSKSDYTITPLQSVGAMTAAFSAGTIQGFVLPSSIVQPLVKKISGSSVVQNFQTPDFPWIGAGILVNGDFAKQHPVAVQNVLRGLDAALDLLRSNPTAAKKSLGQFIGVTDEAQVDAQYQSLLNTFSKQVEPVESSDLKTIYEHLRQVTGNDKLSDQLAEKLPDQSYLKAIR